MRLLFRNTLTGMLATLSILMSFPLYSQSLADISFGTDSTLDIVSWNIEWFPKNGSATADSVQKIIESLDADIIGLQEISDTALCRQVINNLPDYNLIFDEDWSSGLAYVYKTSTINLQAGYTIYDTSPFWYVFPRAPLVMEFTYMDEDFVVINNHLKCCGNGVLDLSDPSDEESRRHAACTLLKEHVDLNLSFANAFVIGDLNDLLIDLESNNVFQMFIDDSANYKFTDQAIAEGPISNWSYPGWPSHLDHILITDELFDELENTGSLVQTIRVEDYLPGGLSDYDNIISDHRPVGLKLKLTQLSSSAQEILPASFSIFPNPSNGNFVIDLNELSGPVGVSVTDLEGKLVQSAVHNGGQLINLSLNGPSGVYFLRISSGDKIFVSRLIKE